MLPYQSGANDLIEGPFLGGYMEISAPNESATLSGRACGRLVNSGACRRTIGVARSTTRSCRTCMLSIHPDYVNYYLLTPVGVDRTIVESEWMFHPDERAAIRTFNPADAIAFWDVTNRQDWDIVERSQLGICVASLRARPVLAAREHAGGVGSGVPEADGVGPPVHRSTGPPLKPGRREAV